MVFDQMPAKPLAHRTDTDRSQPPVVFAHEAVVQRAGDHIQTSASLHDVRGTLEPALEKAVEQTSAADRHEWFL
jgi:hypothetical protein